jgi:hypothetical protein
MRVNVWAMLLCSSELRPLTTPSAHFCSSYVMPAPSAEWTVLESTTAPPIRRSMGLFSKLFSRDGEEPTESEGQDAQAPQPGGEDGVKKTDESAGSQRDARKAEPVPPSAAQNKQVGARTEAGMGGQQPAPGQKRGGPPLEPPDAAGKAGKKNEPAKRDGVAAKPPAAGIAAPAPAAARAAQTVVAPVVPPAATLDPSQSPAARRGITGAKPVTEVAVQGKVPGSPIPPLPAAHDTGSMQLDAAVDAAMARITDVSGNQVANEQRDAGDQRAVAETFADIAKVHAHPLRELMFQLSVGRTPRQWAATCRPVLKPLFDAATQIGLLELVGGLGAFDAALERAAAEPNAFIGDAAAEALTGAYERLRKQMPDAFMLPDRADHRRMILLESLLLQIPDMHRRTLAKLYAAGLSSLGQLGTAKPEEIAVVAGIDRALAQTVVEHIQRFDQERSRMDPTTLRGHVHERLRALAGRLSRLQTEFEQAEEDDSVARKREARRNREAAVLELDLVLAEVGDVDVIEELKRCPVRGKIQRVESYLERLQASA